MTETNETIAARIEARFGEKVTRVDSTCGELTYEVDKDDVIDVAMALRDEEEFSVDQCVDASGIDYLTYGEVEWKTEDATETGFSRGVERKPVTACSSMVPSMWAMSVSSMAPKK